MAQTVALGREKVLPTSVRGWGAVVIASLLLSLAGPLAIPLPFTPVPLALAPHLCLFLALTLGKTRASLVVLGYLLQGAMGLPVFALGASGVLHLIGPRGGYLIGYLAATYLTGYLVEKNRSTRCVALSLIAGNAVIYLFGAAQLSLFFGVSSACTLGVLPFLAGDGLKIVALLTFFKKR